MIIDPAVDSNAGSIALTDTPTRLVLTLLC